MPFTLFAGAFTYSGSLGSATSTITRNGLAPGESRNLRCIAVMGKIQMNGDTGEIIRQSVIDFYNMTWQQIPAGLS